MEKYDYKISYEELLEWFEKQNDSKRMRVKQMVLENGIRRAKTGYVQQLMRKQIIFYKYYEKIGRENNPELGIRFTNNMHQIIHGSVSNQVYFHPTSKLCIKAMSGIWICKFQKLKMDEFLKNMESKISKNMTIQKTGNSFQSEF